MITFCLILMLQQEQPAKQPVEPAKQESAESSLLAPLSGTVTALYRVRWTSDESDSDLYEFLNARYGNPDSDLVTASLSARFAEDLDGQQDTAGFFVFDSIDDTYESSVTARIYTAYLTLSRPMPGLTARAGRQVVDQLPEAVPMDGALAGYEFSTGALRGAEIGAFGGLPANFFESSPSGDLMFGGWMEAPVGRGSVGLQYLHLKDDNLFGVFKDDLFGLSVQQKIGVATATARYTILEGNSRDLTARATIPLTRYDFIVDGQATYVFKAIHALAYPIDPYSTFLIELEPYAQISLRASKEVGTHFSVEAALAVRELVSEDDEKEFNREFQHWSLIPRTKDWPAKNLSLALSFDFWQSSNDFWTLGGDVTYRVHPRFTLAAGTGFSLYSINAVTGDERERVREVYLTAKWKLLPDTLVDFKFSIDRDDFDTFNTVDLGVRRAF